MLRALRTLRCDRSHAINSKALDVIDQIEYVGGSWHAGDTSYFIRYDLHPRAWIFPATNSSFEMTNRESYIWKGLDAASVA